MLLTTWTTENGHGRIITRIEKKSCTRKEKAPRIGTGWGGTSTLFDGTGKTISREAIALRKRVADWITDCSESLGAKWRIWRLLWEWDYERLLHLRRFQELQRYWVCHQTCIQCRIVWRRRHLWNQGAQSHADELGLIQQFHFLLLLRHQQVHLWKDIVGSGQEAQEWSGNADHWNGWQRWRKRWLKCSQSGEYYTFVNCQWCSKIGNCV